MCRGNFEIKGKLIKYTYNASKRNQEEFPRNFSLQKIESREKFLTKMILTCSSNIGLSRKTKKSID